MGNEHIDRLGPRSHRRWLAGLVAASGVVLTWKGAALALLERGRGEDAASPPLALLLSLAGLVFVACGLLILWRRPSRSSAIFAGFALCAGLHWGGPLELEAGPARTALIILYLLVSGIMAACLLLHFSLVFPRRLFAERHATAVRMLYAPLLLACALALAATSWPGSPVRQAATDAFLIVHTLVSNLFSFAALVVFAVHLFRPGTDRKLKIRVAVLIAGMLVAWVPYLVASSLGVDTDPWNLTVVALPIAATVAVLGGTEPREPAP